MAEILATVELTEDRRILFLRAYSEVRISMQVGSEQGVRNGRIEVRDTKKMGLHLALFGRENVGKPKYEWVFHGAVKMDRTGVYHIAVKPDKNRRGYCGPGEFYYGYRVRQPQEESDPIRRQIMADWNTCKRLRVNEVRDWGEVLEIDDLYTSDLTQAAREELPFGQERFLTDGRPELVQQHNDRQHVRVNDASYVIVVLEEANSDPCDRKMDRKGVTRVYRKPGANLDKVLAAIASMNPRKYTNFSLY